jgi:hypothetical protein
MTEMIVNDRSPLPHLIRASCVVFAVGCQPAPEAPQHQPPPQQMTVMVNAPQGNPNSDPAARPEQIEGAIHSDPCSARLHEISGALLEYYALHGRLPVRLEDLNALPDLDQPLSFSCPASGKPFVYVPSGLVRLADPQPIVLFDPAVDRAGLRWVIRLRRPTPHEAGTTFVEHLPEAVFKTFVPAQ